MTFVKFPRSFHVLYILIRCYKTMDIGSFKGHSSTFSEWRLAVLITAGDQVYISEIRPAREYHCMVHNLTVMTKSKKWHGSANCEVR